MITIDDIAAALHAQLPTELHAHIPALAQVLARLSDTNVSPEEARLRLADPTLVETLQALVGQRVPLVGGDYIEIGDIHQAKGIAVGTGAVALGDIFIRNVAPEQVYDVGGLPNPYLGLAAFTYDDRDSYAGRDALVRATVAQITAPGEEQSFLLVTGASGIGKSSFVQAGLVPALETHYEALGFTLRRTLSVRPGRQPLAALTRALKALELPPIDSLTARSFLTDMPRIVPGPSQVAMLVIDQFEELFTQSDSVQRDTLIAVLASLPPFAQLPIHIIATLRSDFLPQLLGYAALEDAERRKVVLRAMDATALREAIQRPLQRKAPDKRFEPDLLDLLVRDTVADAAYLPLLQVTLEDLWRSGTLRRSTYGGLVDAIQRRADAIYTWRDYDGGREHVRSPDEQAAIMSVLLDLVSVSLDDDPQRDVRRRRALADVTRGDPTRLRLVTELASARLLATSVEMRRDVDEQMVDIIHERLLSGWNRLATAIQEARTGLRQRTRFEHALRDWLAAERADAWLLTGIPLAEAEALAAERSVVLEGSDAKELLRRSIATREAERERELAQARMLAEEQTRVGQRLRRLTWFLALALVGALLAAGAAALFGVQARSSAVQAQRQGLASAAQAAFVRGELEQALALALAAIDKQPSDPPAEVLARPTAPHARPEGIHSATDHRQWLARNHRVADRQRVQLFGAVAILDRLPFIPGHGLAAGRGRGALLTRFFWYKERI